MMKTSMTKGRALRCYISAPIGINIENIQSSLMQRNVQLLFPSSISKAYNVHESIRELISNADLVIGVLRRGRHSKAVLFELGMAVAMERQNCGI